MNSKRICHQHANLLSTNGYVLIGCACLLIAFTFLVQMLGVHQQKNTFNAPINAQETHQNLARIHTGLLAFAATSGYNSLSQLGNLPCPSLTPGGAPQTTCLNSAVGFLAEQGVIKINYTRGTVPMLWDQKKYTQQKSWAYAVSPRLLQPNELGWSQWVDFQQPALTVHTPTETRHDIVAVVAHALQSIGPNELNATPPLTTISQAELDSTLKLSLKAYINNTLTQWKTHIAPQAISSTPNENLQNTGPHTAQLINSGCQCHCTKTRCLCSCTQPTTWNKTDGTTCTSTATAPCTLPHAAQLSSQWPVSQYSPNPISNTSCRPQRRNECPLSTNSTACDCQFSWPNPVLSALQQQTLEVSWP